LLPSPRELPNGFTEPFFRGVAKLLMDNHLCSFLANVEALYPVEHSAAGRCSLHRFQITDDEYQKFNTFFPQQSRGQFLPMIIAFHFVTLTTR
jgi:hypothetical protein